MIICFIFIIYVYLLFILLLHCNSIHVYSIISIPRDDFIERSTTRNEFLIIIIFYFNCNVRYTESIFSCKNINIELKFSLNIILYYFNVNESNYICNTNYYLQ